MRYSALESEADYVQQLRVPWVSMSACPSGWSQRSASNARSGYSGDLCHDGSTEYVAFWADLDDKMRVDPPRHCHG